ncbi:MAG: ABC transporter permease [Janthinobacterium lividum]
MSEASQAVGFSRSPAAVARAIAMRRSALRRRTWQRVLPWAVIIGAFALWEFVVRAFGIEQFVLPSPVATFESMWQWRGPLFENAMQTLFTSILGFLLAVVGGLVLGCAIGGSTLVYAALYPMLIGFNAIPKVAVVPILVIWFGIGTVPAVITAFLLSFFPIVVNVATGIATVEPELRDVMRALGAGPLDIILKIGLPRAMPYFFASLKIAVSVAFVGSILAETIAANSGIGHLMVVASSRFDVPLVFAALLVTSALGVAMYLVAAFVERRMTGWTVRTEPGTAAIAASPG